MTHIELFIFHFKSNSDSNINLFWHSCYSSGNSCATGKKVAYFDVFGQLLTFFGMSMDVHWRLMLFFSIFFQGKSCPKTSLFCLLHMNCNRRHAFSIINNKVTASASFMNTISYHFFVSFFFIYLCFMNSSIF